MTHLIQTFSPCFHYHYFLDGNGRREKEYDNFTLDTLFEVAPIFTIKTNYSWEKINLCRM